MTNCVEWERWRVTVAAVVALVVATMYACLLMTRLGREVYERRVEWVVLGLHLLMAGTMALVSYEAALLFLVWSVASGAPMVVRSAVVRWVEERGRWEAVDAALRAALGGRGGQAGRDSSD